MKRLLFTIISISVLAFTACDNDLDTNCIEVRLVEEICGNAILMVVDQRADLKLSSWTDHEGEVYENVFGTFLDPCASNYPEDRESSFFVALADSAERTNCAICLALPASMPEQFYNIRIVEPCQQSSID